MKATAHRSIALPATGGFTLIELMITVAIIAILLSIAIPSYQQYVRQSYRSQAQSCMMQTAHAMERRYTTNLSYAGDDPALGCRNEGNLNTRYSITVGDIATRIYTITATAIDDQTRDNCGSMTLNQLGVKTPTTAGCW